MKLPFDENLSFRLPALVDDLYPRSTHVRAVGLKGKSDGEIWEYAAPNGFAVVSKDADFYQRSLLLGSPPKIVWLRVENAPTRTVAALLRDPFATVEAFVLDPESAFLVLAAR